MKTAIITGAYGEIGREIARGMVLSNFHTILVGRDQPQLKKLNDELNTLNSGTKVEYRTVNLSDKRQIFDFAKDNRAPIDVLINNAATAPRNRTESDAGVEIQWATNVLSYYWMILAFENHLNKAQQGRVVNVASYWAGGLDLDDPEFKRRPYNNDQAYRQSKQADRMLSYGFSDLYGGAIKVNACHPGDANSKLSNNLGFGGSQSAYQAAETPLFLAIDQGISQVTGAYFANCRQASCQFKNDSDGIRRLMELCSRY